jgi:hypothetical protein
VNETTVECIEPSPTSSYACNNQTGIWEIDSLTVYFGESIVFRTPSLVKGDLILQPGATATFKEDNITFVDGFVSVASYLVLDFGNRNDEGLFYKLVSEKLHSITLISGASGFQITSSQLKLLYTGGCTSISGALNLVNHETHEYRSRLVVSHLSKKGTGNCHWVWSLLSFIGAMATLIIVPLIEKYAWKIYD